VFEIIVNNIKENFEIKQDKKRRLLDGLDDIDLTLDSENIIELFEKNRTIPSII
jgi:3-isopropylmalate dehydratase small subunit